MATNGHSGHPLKWFRDQNFARSSFECAICMEVLKDPVQVRNCGHQFCGLCIEDILRTDPRCPTCRIGISQAMVFADQAANRLVRKLDVNCSNRGCNWIGHLSSFLEGHINTCNFGNLMDGNHNLDVCKIEEEFETRLKSEISKLKQKHENDLKELKSKYENDLKELKSKNQEDLRELKQEISQLRSMSNCSGTFTMKIPQIFRKLSQATSSPGGCEIKSDPFFSSYYGYKMRISVHLDERRHGYAGHIGVYISIMKSDHDGMLTWPFEKPCSITLIDQQDYKWYRQDHVMMLVPEGEKGFKRPSGEETSGIGYRNFVSHSKLRTRRYIKDNAIYITLQVES